MSKCYLILSDGTVYTGERFGAPVDSVGEQQHLVSRLFEQMEGETECGTLAYTRQRGEVFNGIGQGV